MYFKLKLMKKENITKKLLDIILVFLNLSPKYETHTHLG